MDQQTNSTTALATTTSAPAPAELAKRAPESGGAIDAFASQGNFEAAQRMARAMSTSSLVPEAYRNNIPNVLIAMELAARIGASVFAVMQNIDIIHGRPSWRATFLIATVNASARFTPIRFRFEGKEGTDGWGCRAVAKDRESGEECLGAFITIALATSEGWFGKSGSKWKTMPEQMLMYRAAAFWARIYAPELSLGMHTSDELADQYGAYAPTVSDAEIVNEPTGPARTLEDLKARERAAAKSTTAPMGEPGGPEPPLPDEREPGSDG